MTVSPYQELTHPTLGGQVQHYDWTYQGQTVTLAYETSGAGPMVLLLPAFSTVSTRAELAQIAQVLASQFQVIALDWLGFGESERPAFTYKRSLYQALLKDFVQNCCPGPVGILAAGHGAGYALHLAQNHLTQNQISTRLLLVAPTWKGPLRAMGAPGWLAASLRSLVGLPIVGSALYGANTHPAFLKWMYQRHVFVDQTRLTPTFIQQRHRITQQPGARFAPAAFVTAALDPMGDRTEWLQIATAVTADPNNSVRVILADQAPPQSKAEMQALSELPGIQTDHLPGSLGLYEEYGAEVGVIALAHFQA
ncbi:alpha/beta fold hydrolase [Leptothoe sp. LEGE 181152]|nr:alpha/beta fold hydrolase [Leptothoe sp. LEGE 181152]